MKFYSIMIFFLTILLILIGLVIVLTASSSFSAKEYGDSFYMFKEHLYKVGLAIVAFLIAAVIPYEFYKYISRFLIVAIVIALIVTLFFAVDKKGAARWLTIFGLQFQPTDAAKLLLIIHLSYLLDKKEEYINEFGRGFLPLIIWTLLVAGLIILQPNVSNAILIVLTSLILIFVGGASTKHVATTLSIFAFAAISIAMLYPHAQKRLLTYINSVFYGGENNIQVQQALVSLGSGGIIGVGVGNSKQNNLFLPEAYGDFIFGIIGEQIGLFGTVGVLLTFLAFIFYGIKISKRTSDRFGQLLALGITLMIGVFALVNILVSIGLLPTTGLPLPFISYGGTSILFNSIGAGILLNIAIINYIRELERKKAGLGNNRKTDE